ncbi:hypothetical protein C1I98_24005 [Spongiactinospora gelatinilytica]|uniref:Uncharacterized protein n=1 Tax=Spongiactinospora gelatinilytica TaxID=2666298 RepID=A0A2W2GF80_9ACTN|nr:hypothetical protein [Spongiactinospora gelatinilytica]PZG38875.1 hypothetical protein C1I98_24005 [Spongiactinospora gelatinilytica]
MREADHTTDRATARHDEPDDLTGQTTLERRVRVILGQAGFVVDPTALAVDGGLQIHRVSGRGVLVSWISTANLPNGDITRYAGIREAIHLALTTILRRRGFTVAADPDTGDLIISDAGD